MYPTNREIFLIFSNFQGLSQPLRQHVQKLFMEDIMFRSTCGKSVLH